MAQGENSLPSNTGWLHRLGAVIADIGHMPRVAATATPVSIGRLRIELFLTSFTLLFFELTRK